MCDQMARLVDLHGQLGLRLLGLVGWGGLGWWGVGCGMGWGQGLFLFLLEDQQCPIRANRSNLVWTPHEGPLLGSRFALRMADS